MAQGSPVIAGVSNTAIATTEILTTGAPSPRDTAFKVTNATHTVGIGVNHSTGIIAISSNASALGADALYATARGRGLYAVGVDGEAVRAYSYQNNGTYSYGKINGVMGVSYNPDASGVYGENNGGGWGTAGRTSGATRAGVFGDNTGQGPGVLGVSATGIGVQGKAHGSPPAIQGENESAQLGSVGVLDKALGSGTGMLAETEAGTGVVALGGSGVGLYASGDRAPIRLRPAAIPGSPTAGFHEVGELMVDSNGALYFCKATGTPGTWALVA